MLLSNTNRGEGIILRKYSYACNYPCFDASTFGRRNGTRSPSDFYTHLESVLVNSVGKVPDELKSL